MRIERTNVTKLLISEVQDIDPITVFLEDYEPGKGKITVTCWGQSWTAYWGGMSGDDVATFFCRVSAAYIIGYFAPQLHSTQFSGTALVEKSKRVVLDCRRGRTAKHYPLSLDKEEARQLFDRIEDDLRHVERPDHCFAHSDLLSQLFGDEWHHDAGDATEPNPDYGYLERIIAAVQEALQWQACAEAA